MSPLFVIFGILAVVTPLFFSIYFKNKVDQLTTDNEILKRRNKTLEERFSQEEEQTTKTSTPLSTGVEILHTFAQSYQVQLEPAKNYDNEDWELYSFSYQGGHFHCFAGKETDEVLIRYAHFCSLPYSDDALFRTLRLCVEFTANRRYAKLTYTIDTNDLGEQEIHFHFCFDMIGILPIGLEYLLNHNFILAREASEAVDAIRKELEELEPAGSGKVKTEADYQAMAIQMAMKQAQEGDDVEEQPFQEEDSQYLSYDARGARSRKDKNK